jgi:hypothetical protein
MESKVCFKCGIEKPLSDYYVHPRMGDGHLGKCKECTKKDSNEHEKLRRLEPDWVESERVRGREKYHRLGYKKQCAIYRLKYPEIKIATTASQYMTKPGFENHHWSYNKEHRKDILQLTISEHRKAHRYLIYDQERMMFRRNDTLELLDTKELHIEFITNHLN